MKKNVFLILSFVILVASACSNDDNSGNSQATAVAFINQSANVTTAETAVNIVFSAPTSGAGTVTLNVISTDLTYGTDFTTNPDAVNNVVIVSFEENVSSATFTFNKLIDALEGEVKNVKFTIASVSIAGFEIPIATNSTQLNFNETAIVSNALTALNGGNKVPNQVYIDFSSGSTTNIVRTSWDFGFSTGSEFRVVSNGAINKFAVKQLNTTNIDEVQEEDTNVTTGNYEASNMAYVDAPYGNLSGTAIAEISNNDADNKVYLVNLGNKISSVPGTGTGVALTGDNRGWKKIRILKSGNDYKLQYADIDATTHSEVIISKNAAFNFTFFSFDTNGIVQVEPQKDKWDLNITTFTSETFYQTGESAGAYYFPDFAITNTKAGTRAIQVLNASVSFDSYSLANATAADFESEMAKDQRVIGSNWRATYPLGLKTDRFYVIKDIAGNYYKLKFTAMQNTDGERGHVSFEYQILQ